MQTRGQCALCETYADLCESHVRLPKFVFKRLLQRDAKNPNPVLISTNGVWQSSKQETQPLLCRGCESRFSKHGEHWVAGVCLRDNNVTFPLMESFWRAGLVRHYITPEAGAFYAGTVPDLRFACLEYFAASMVWRGQFLIGQRYSLGPYDQQFRDYLLGWSSFPPDASLHLFLRYRSGLSLTSHGMSRHRNDLATSYDFSIPGLTFTMYVGKHRSNWLKEASFNENGYRPILDMDIVDRLERERIEAVMRQAVANGKRIYITQALKSAGRSMHGPIS